MANLIAARVQFALVGFFLLFAAVPLLSQTPAFDVVITHGHIIDGTGSPWYSGDLGIRDGKIAAIGNLAAAPRKRTIDAAGKVVAPGFIDMLGQSELTILVDPRLPSKVFQGITSEITGEGNSIAPLNDAIIQSDRSGYEHFKITPDWRTFRQYFARLEKQGMGINLASYVGATQVRRMVLGDDDSQMVGHRRVQLTQLLLLLLCLLNLAQQRIANRKVVIERRVFRIEADRLIVVTDGAVVIAFVVIGDTA